MRTREMRVLGLLGLVALVVALFVVLKDDDGSDSTAPAQTTAAATTTTPADSDDEPGNAGNAEKPGDKPGPPAADIPVIRFEGGEVVGGVQELEFAKGEAIRFKVHSDLADEVHLHGYDVSQEVKAGHTISFDVPADLEGVFEVELENAVVPLAEVTVTP